MSQNVQELRVDRDERVESGAVVFKYNNGETDWNGLWLRGDNAFGISQDIRTVWLYLKEQKLPGEVYLAMLGLVSICDDIQKEVVVGGAMFESMRDDLLQRKKAT